MSSIINHTRSSLTQIQKFQSTQNQCEYELYPLEMNVSETQKSPYTKIEGVITEAEEEKENILSKYFVCSNNLQTTNHTLTPANAGSKRTITETYGTLPFPKVSENTSTNNTLEPLLKKVCTTPSKDINLVLEIYNIIKLLIRSQNAPINVDNIMIRLKSLNINNEQDKAGIYNLFTILFIFKCNSENKNAFYNKKINYTLFGSFLNKYKINYEFLDPIKYTQDIKIFHKLIYFPGDFFKGFYVLINNNNIDFIHDINKENSQQIDDLICQDTSLSNDEIIYFILKSAITTNNDILFYKILPYINLNDDISYPIKNHENKTIPLINLIINWLCKTEALLATNTLCSLIKNQINIKESSLLKNVFYLVYNQINTFLNKNIEYIREGEKYVNITSYLENLCEYINTNTIKPDTLKYVKSIIFNICSIFRIIPNEKTPKNITTLLGFQTKKINYKLDNLQEITIDSTEKKVIGIGDTHGNTFRLITDLVKTKMIEKIPNDIYNEISKIIEGSSKGELTYKIYIRFKEIINIYIHVINTETLFIYFGDLTSERQSNDIRHLLFA